MTAWCLTDHKGQIWKEKRLFSTYLVVNCFPTAALTRLAMLFLAISIAPDSRLSLISLENGTLGAKKQSTPNLQPWLWKQPITFNLNKGWAIYFFFKTRYCQSLSLRTAAHIKTDTWLTDLIRRGKLRISEFPRDLSATSRKPGLDLKSSAAGQRGELSWLRWPIERISWGSSNKRYIRNQGAVLRKRNEYRYRSVWLQEHDAALLRLFHFS